jgi:hypothetical protein
LDLAAFGAAYLAALANLVVATMCFIGARVWLVITPNRAARNYGVYTAAVLTALLVATVLENELVPGQAAALHYAMVPHLLTLLVIHLWISHRQEPWLVALAGSSLVGMLMVGALAGAVGNALGPPHWLGLAVLGGLLGFLWTQSISTKRGFIKARSIYAESKERREAPLAPQRPWLGLAQWVALAAASVLLATLNSLLRGSAVAQIPAVQVLAESTLLIVVTAAVCAVPATSYWLARKAWMPELTRFVWLVWIIVGFAFTYGNYLTSLHKA